MSESLKQKTVRGTAWSFIDNISGQGITFLVGLVLANILSPAEYGLIAIISIFIAVFNSLVDSGFSNALIRKNNATDVDYNTIFLFNLAISILLFFCLYFLAPYISLFFNQPELTSLTRVMSSIVLINAFAIIQRTRLVKNIDFKTQTKISVIASTISGAIGIGMAIRGCGVWSLAGQQISRQTLNTILLWFFNRWMPRLQFSIESFNELFSFGWKLLVSSLIDTIWREIYQVVIGRFYSPATLGQYERARQFNMIFSNNLTAIIQRVSYPVLSSIQDNNERMKQAYKKIIKTTMYISFICMLGLCAIAKSLILVLIGEEWLPAVEFLQIICFSGMMYPLHAINLNMLQVQGRSDLFLRLEIIKKFIAIGPILLGVFVGIKWMLIGSAITGFFAYYLNSYYSGKKLNYSMLEQVKDILPSFTIAIIMAIVVYAISYINITPVILLPLQIVVGAIMVLILSILFKNKEFIELKSIATSFIKR